MRNKFENQAYQPSPKEIKKAEGMMTEEQKEKSEQREATFEAGEKHGMNKVIKMTEKEFEEQIERERSKLKSELEREDTALKIGLSEKTKNFFIEGMFDDFMSSFASPKKYIDKESFVEFIGKFYSRQGEFGAKSYNDKRIEELDSCDVEYLVMDENVLKFLYDKFPYLTIRGTKDMEKFIETINDKELRDHMLSSRSRFHVCGG